MQVTWFNSSKRCHPVVEILTCSSYCKAMAAVTESSDIESALVGTLMVETELSTSLSIHASDSETNSLWTSLQRLPSSERITAALLEEQLGDDDECEKRKTIVNVTRLGAQERHRFIERLLKDVENDNQNLLQKLRQKMDSVGVRLPTVELRYKNLCVDAECEVVHGKPLPTLWNTAKSMLSGLVKLSFLRQEAKLGILKHVSGIIKPGRMTLLLGPPGCGKTTLLRALSGRLSHSLQVSGEISYNGYRLDEFVPQKTSVYVSQDDVHVPEMTVRETIDFSARCQGIGHRADVMMEVSRREKQQAVVPDPDVDTFLKAISAQGLQSNLQTDYILKILGLDICADTIVGDAMRRGISGGQKRRLTTGEMIVGPAKALLMDEISNGLDSSTTFQIVSCLRHLTHFTDKAVLISLLQPAPEVFDLFDDIILMAEGKIVYHGPCSGICKFFDDCGFRCPERKSVADFLQQVISIKDQAQYWYHREQPYSYISTDQFVKLFKESHHGKRLDDELSNPSDRSNGDKSALEFTKYSLSKGELFKACSAREFLLMKRNSFTYVFKSVQLLIMASVTMTVFLRTRMAVDAIDSNYYMSAIFFALITLLVDGYPEVQMTVSRLAVFYKQRDLYLYPAWAYAIPASLLKIPLSFLEALVWTALTYYVIGYSPEIGRFLGQFFLLFLVHLASVAMFRFVASMFQTVAAAMAVASFTVLTVFLFGGFIIKKPSMPAWLEWGFWISPLAYGEIGLAVNEFLAPRWGKNVSGNTTTTTLGQQTLESRGLNFDGYFYWISVAALIGLTLLFNIGFTLALTFLKPPGRARAVISYKQYNQLHGEKDGCDCVEQGKGLAGSHPEHNAPTKKRTVVLPFEPLTMTFQDVQYHVDTPLEMRKRGFQQKKIQLLSDITGAFRPGILTALMGVSGAGKTTLMDVLSGRKTRGVVQGQIRIGSYPKVQDTFARISGYCEQTDVHSPHITVEESVTYSAWLRLPSEIDQKTRSDFVNEVLETVELDGIKDHLVGIPGVSGLSTEQRKRLTIAVELVANPSIVFMDEPTSSLDARAAAIVVRAVKNVAETGRTVVCTIHQPSIDVFESFEELIVMKIGGRIIYSGPLGQNSSRVIEYFESIHGVPKIKENSNPAAWMLEVTCKSMEAKLGIDFEQIYKESTLYEERKELVWRLSTPIPGSKDLHFHTRFPQNGWEQLKACFWKHNLSYWRNPAYNLLRIVFVSAASFLFGLLFWQKGEKIENQQDLFNLLGSMYCAIIFFGICNCTTVQHLVAAERTIMYREKFAGMYSSWAYSFSQLLVEVPYLVTQAVLYVIITYPMIGYSLSAHKVLWSFYAMLCSLLCYNYLGMLLISITPNIQLASILTSLAYTMQNLFAGFIVPKPQIPKWWLWLYYTCPGSWILNGMFTSQYGDVQKEISAFGETKNVTVAAFLEDYFGYHSHLLGVTAIVIIIFPIVLASLFAYFIHRLNFQKR